MHLFSATVLGGHLPLWGHDINAGQPVWPPRELLVANVTAKGGSARAR